MRGCLLALVILVLALLTGGCRDEDTEAPPMATAAQVAQQQASVAQMLAPAGQAQVRLVLEMVQQADTRSGGLLARHQDLYLLAQELVQTLVARQVPVSRWGRLVPEMLAHQLQAGERVRQVPELDDRLQPQLLRAAGAMQTVQRQQLDQELTQALATGRQNLRLAEQQLRRAQRQTAGILSTQASLAAARLDWAGAAERLEQAFELRGVADSSPQTIAWLLEAADAWQAAGQEAAALRVLLRAREVVRKQSGWLEEQGRVALRLGGVLQVQGQLSAAQESYAEAVQARRSQLAELAAQGGVSGERVQRELAASLDHLAGLLRQRGDLAAALAAYQEGLQLRSGLSRADAASVPGLRDVSVSHNKVGELQQEMGDLSAALRSYQKGLELMHQVRAAEPGQAAWLRDLSISHDRLGDVYRARGETRQALASYLDALAIRQQQAQKFPESAEWRLDIAVSCWKITQLGPAAGSLPQRRMWLETGLNILRELHARQQLPAVRQAWIPMFGKALAELH